MGCRKDIYFRDHEKEEIGDDVNVEIVRTLAKVNPEALDDVEMLQDMVMLAFNDVLSKIDKETEERLGKYTQGMPGLF